MLFERGTRPFGGWFATHPPLLERIRALEPGFDPRDLPAPSAAAGRRRVDARAAARRRQGSSPRRPRPRRRSIAPARSPRPRGRAVRDALPDEVYEATRSRDSSLLVVVALALSGDERTRDKQLALIERQLGATRAGLCPRLFDELAPTPADLRLPVLELALPTLRQRPSEQLFYVSELLERVQELEQTPRLFDFVLLPLVETYLNDLPGTEGRAAHAERAERSSTAPAVRVLLGNVAAFGNETAAGARAAYAAGLASVGWRAEPADPQFEPPGAAALSHARRGTRSARVDPTAREGARPARRARRNSSRCGDRDRGTGAVPPDRRRARLPAAARHRSETPLARAPKLVKMLASRPREHHAPNSVHSLCAAGFARRSRRAAARPAAAQRNDADKFVDAAKVLELFTTDEENGIPTDILQRARGIAVIPNLIRGGFFFGGRRGRGVIAIRSPNGEWSNPAFLTLTAGASARSSARRARTSCSYSPTIAPCATSRNGKFTLGGDATAVAGPMGRRTQAAVTGRAEVYVYMHSRGLFAGATFEGHAPRYRSGRERGVLSQHERRTARRADTRDSGRRAAVSRCFTHRGRAAGRAVVGCTERRARQRQRRRKKR